jgi:hypothetical protein
LTGSVTFLWTLYYKIVHSIDITLSWEKIQKYLDNQISIPKWYVLYAILIFFITLVNRRIIVNIITWFIKLLLARTNISKHKYLFSNIQKGNKKIGAYYSLYEKHDFKIKPIQNTKEWKICFYFSHQSYDNFNEANIDKLRRFIISKKYDENKLVLESPNTDIFNNRFTTLVDNYDDQMFELTIDYNYAEGGLFIIITRNDAQIIISKVIFGCTDFIIKPFDSHYDYCVEIEHRIFLKR